MHLGNVFSPVPYAYADFITLRKDPKLIHRGKVIFLLINMVQKTIYSYLLKSLNIFLFFSFFQLQMKAGQQEKPSYCFHPVDTRAPWKMPD